MGKKFIQDKFLLHNKTGEQLYEEFAKNEPILDYHSHLSAADIAANRRFNNLFEIWLEGDHYKWRAMRANGVAEHLCTGGAAAYDKFLAWAATVPHTLRNPLYHWTHLELQRYFGISRLLDAGSAAAVWEEANARLATPELRVWGILDKFQVRVVCTTDDPADDLAAHGAIAAGGCPTRVLPTYRPDKVFLVDRPEIFNCWVDQLGERADVDIGGLADLLDALGRRHDDFHAHGCRLSDHGLERAFADDCSEAEAGRIFAKVRGGAAAAADERGRFISYMLLYFGRLDAAKGWTKQLHLGPLRNNRTRLLREAGPDAGADSMDDQPQARALAAYLDRLDVDGCLPRMILYNLNPAANYVFATMAGNFQDGTIAGKVQFGSGWWFLDQKEGMEWQLNALSSLGLLSRFVGMLTDSRSFMSFPRHEYFRRVLCNLIGRDVENGEIPDEPGLVGPMIRNICYGNARDFLGLGGG
jgi:glucuronate isomerase